MWEYAHECKAPRRSGGQATKIPRAGYIGSCKLLNMGLRRELGFSTKDEPSLQHPNPFILQMWSPSKKHIINYVY